MIIIQDIYKTYVAGDREVKALQGVSLSIEKGEFLFPEGKSGDSV